MTRSDKFFIAEMSLYILALVVLAIRADSSGDVLIRMILLGLVALLVLLRLSDIYRRKLRR